MATQTHISPSGRGQWLKVLAPNMRFVSETKPHGTYDAEQVLTPEEAEPLIELITNMDNAHFSQVASDALKAHREKNPGTKDTFKDGLDFAKKRGIERNPLPFKPELDANLEETGNMVFKYKEDAKWVRKSDGKEWDMRPKVVNHKNQKWDESIEIGNGSIIKVAFEMSPYYAKAVGVSLKLRGVQVIELVEYGGGSGPGLFREEEGDTPDMAEAAVTQAEEMFANTETEDVPF